MAKRRYSTLRRIGRRTGRFILGTLEGGVGAYIMPTTFRKSIEGFEYIHEERLLGQSLGFVGALAVNSLFACKHGFDPRLIPFISSNGASGIGEIGWYVIKKIMNFGQNEQ
jgi:hypothetical protein